MWVWLGALMADIGKTTEIIEVVPVPVEEPVPVSN